MSMSGRSKIVQKFDQILCKLENENIEQSEFIKIQADLTKEV